MILIVCLNLAVDETMHVDTLEIGHVHRSTKTLREAGSKGVNVARVLGTLGQTCTITGFLGGPKGQFIADSLAQSGIRCSPCFIENESRSCFIFVENLAFRQTVINEPGPRIAPEETDRFFKQFAGLLAESDLVLISGSSPPGVPADAYARVISLSRRAGKRTLLDSSGIALQEAVKAGPFLLKVNDEEARGLVTHSFSGAIETAATARQICRGGNLAPEFVMITLGANGAVLASRNESYTFSSPKIAAKNSVGSGDAAFAGLTAALAQGLPLEEMGRMAVAAGAANALHGGGHCTQEEILLLKKEIRSQRIDLD